ncbi:MAG: Lrp/AsnC family transcriptional regulator [Thermodesulfobacteriota bacterium]
MKSPTEKGLSALEKAIVSELTGDLQVTSQPFAPIAQTLGISQRQLLNIVRRLKKEGYIRRFGATLRHRNSGYSANAMVVWKVPEEKIDEVGQAMASYREVTHCYHRPPQKDWNYNMYTMIHGANEEECRRKARKISQATGITDYQLLFSQKELKKTTMRYFHE